MVDKVTKQSVMGNRRRQNAADNYYANTQKPPPPNREPAMNPKSDIAARTRMFLNLNDRFEDDEPMWMTGGIRVSWGDLRALADYHGEQEPPIDDTEIDPAMMAIARSELADRLQRRADLSRDELMQRLQADPELRAALEPLGHRDNRVPRPERPAPSDAETLAARYASALAEIVATLGPNETCSCPHNGNGKCELPWEAGEALTVAKDALAGKPR